MIMLGITSDCAMRVGPSRMLIAVCDWGDAGMRAAASLKLASAMLPCSDPDEDMDADVS